MRAVVSFWWFPDEEKSFLDFLESTASDVVGLPSYAVEKELLVARPIKELITTDPQNVVLGLSRHAKELVISPCEIVFQNYEVVGRFCVSDMESCVVAFDRGRLANNVLSMSNLCAYWDYPNADASDMIRKPKEFISWAKNVFQWVYKATPEWHKYKSYRVSKRIKAAIEAGDLEVACY